eukprot:TRINITY_DN7069_c0_g1_i2.p2 TRINITY_DN7069_c0_g1~~TRINITY_DN7069_c0_g1_i2.p2  ORF type:complete len:109 (+),score=5.21 TRINITY_DN7069_c0_g1_i2:271-597(+)
MSNASEVGDLAEHLSSDEDDHCESSDVWSLEKAAVVTAAGRSQVAAAIQDDNSWFAEHKGPAHGTRQGHMPGHLSGGARAPPPPGPWRQPKTESPLLAGSTSHQRYTP